MSEISFDLYSKKVKGCFVGKAVGGTLGMPLEGYIGVKKVEYYDPVPTEMVANDDLDNQVVWLETVKRYGLPINRYLIGSAFKRHIFSMFDEYATCTQNIENGLNAPLSGYYDSKFGAGLGAAIRTEIWACLAPGDPVLAAKFAREDSCVDHSGDGVDASMFIAAVESAAFIESDYSKLIEIGLSVINSNSKLHKAILSVINYVKEGKDVFEIRELILKTYFDQNWTNVCINLPFIVAALLTCGGDVSRGLCNVASLGHDADCTCATLGSIFGIIDPDCFEERWTKPLGDELVVSPSISALHEAETITEFSNQIIEIAPEVLSFYNSDFKIIGAENKNLLHKWAKSDKNLSLGSDYSPLENVIAITPITVKVDYPQNVAIAPEKTEKFKARFSNPMDQKMAVNIHLSVPYGWKVEPQCFDLEINGQEETIIEFSVTASGDIRRRRSKNPLDIHIKTEDFTYSVSAGLMQTIDFINISLEATPETISNDVLNGDINIVNSPAHYFEFPQKQQLFAAEFRAPHYIASAIMAAQCTNAMKVWIDGELVLEHDGGEYVPAYHRSEYVKLLTLDDKWHRLTIWVDNKPFDSKGKEMNPHNAIVNVEGGLATPEFRKKYETFEKCDKGELFIGFAYRSGYHLIDKIEWRLPRDNNFF